MKIVISEDKYKLGKQAAEKGAELIQKAIREKGEANIIIATGASQFEMLAELVKKEINWQVVTAFHLDEYIGVSETHPASFRKYLKERFVDLVPVKEFVYINGDVDSYSECKRLGELISKHPIDVAFVGIGENGHLAFNDPPADFETEEPYIVVNLNDDCRRQQMGEGWFKTIEEVPEKAISMSVKQVMKSKSIISSTPDARKANAVYETVFCEISPIHPATILREKEDTFLFLDRDSAARI
ncbi:Glucosamine-6-phosphate deaminase 1 [bioreactor metagenome]|uniref:Glucosamine-6-phosphate deaminase 1 n=1 Tax=bioreactor metagenome TaxID=1076179 RepID=A0A644XZ24_9ZZZZ|nr:glucosamine-6-phosphate deaminase [Paludibacter sp.]